MISAIISFSFLDQSDYSHHEYLVVHQPPLALSDEDMVLLDREWVKNITRRITHITYTPTHLFRRRTLQTTHSHLVTDHVEGERGPLRFVMELEQKRLQNFNDWGIWQFVRCGSVPTYSNSRENAAR